MPLFERYIGIDYSGAKSPGNPLKGIRAFNATRYAAPLESKTPISRHKYWTRRGLAEWLVTELRQGPPTLVGMDHAFSFPVAYFEKYGLPRDWRKFLADFCDSWRTGEPNVRPGAMFDEFRQGKRELRCGDSGWLRLTEQLSRGTPKSVFRWHVNGTVAHSTHAGLPWLKYLDEELGGRVHFWPFDGWSFEPGKSVVAEVYPAIWKHLTAPPGWDEHQRDAWRVAEMLRHLDASGGLATHLESAGAAGVKERAAVEGWILGV